jgi:hypothetical protein
MFNLGNQDSYLKFNPSALVDYFSNKKVILILLLVILFITIAFYVYNTYIAPKINPDFIPNNEFMNNKDVEKNAYLYLFYVKWCPYSKKSLEPWKNVVDKYNGQKINNYNIQMISINGDSEEEKMKDFENTYMKNKKIDGYPSLFLVKDDQVIEYDTDVTVENLSEFIETVL